MVEETWLQECEAASTVKKQEKVNVGAQFLFSFLFSSGLQAIE